MATSEPTVNITINIDKNGTTTLATAGCICKRDIDINVDVPETGGDRSDFIPDSVFVISGNCAYYMCSNKWDWFLNMYGNEISTSDITDANHMFYENTYTSGITKIPFDINLKDGQNVNCTSMFEDNFALQIAPYVKGKVANVGAMFMSCTNLREIPEDFGDYIDWSYLQSFAYASIDKVFYGCRCLRKVPNSLLSNLWNNSATYAPYSQMFGYCCRLDEAKDVPIHQGAMTSNKFTLFVDYCYRLKDLTFAVQEDGTPYTVNWHTQTIDLTKNVGYGTKESEIIDVITGLTTDTQVTDDATYQTLKDSDNWWTLDVAYSRYNHDSAVNTINSLPDTSAYLATLSGKKNIIKFKGESGSKTDGGAINTLTEDEIAVATAKGWTVTIV